MDPFQAILAFRYLDIYLLIKLLDLDLEREGNPHLLHIYMLKNETMNIEFKRNSGIIWSEGSKKRGQLE